MTVEEEVKIMDIQTAAEIRWSSEKGQAELLRMQERATTQLQLEMQAASEHDRVTAFRQVRERDHMKAIGDVQVATAREMNATVAEQERMKNMLQLDYVGAKIAKENEGMQARLAIENSGRLEADTIAARQHERDKEMRGMRLIEDQTRNQMMIETMAQKLGTENEGVKARLAIENGARKEADDLDIKKHYRELEKKRVDGAVINKNIELVDKMKGGGNGPTLPPKIYGRLIEDSPASSRILDVSDVTSIAESNAALYP
jgi:hypothetical protein